MVRISAQLVEGSDGLQRWEQTYDRAPGDEIKIQTDIATNVADALSIALGQGGNAALRLGGTTDTAAQDLYLRASALYVSDTSEKAVREGVKLLDAAISRDPNYANAFRAKASFLEYLATSYSENADEMTRGKDAAEAAARRAIKIAPRLGSAYAELAGIEQDRFNFDKAQQFMRRAMALTPGNSESYLNFNVYPMVCLRRAGKGAVPRRPPSRAQSFGAHKLRRSLCYPDRPRPVRGGNCGSTKVAPTSTQPRMASPTDGQCTDFDEPTGRWPRGTQFRSSRRRLQTGRRGDQSRAERAIRGPSDGSKCRSRKFPGIQRCSNMRKCLRRQGS